MKRKIKMPRDVEIKVKLLGLLGLTASTISSVLISHYNQYYLPSYIYFILKRNQVKIGDYRRGVSESAKSRIQEILRK